MSSRHVRDVVSAMRIVSNYLDELAWSRYLQLWKEIGPTKAAKIIGELLLTANLKACLTVLRNSIDSLALEKEVYETLFEIMDLQTDPSSAIEKAVKKMANRLQLNYRDNSWEWRKDDFPILQEVAKKTSSINEFISEYILDPKLDTTFKKDGKLEDCVRLSTIHSAKGLEADIVYLINASSKAYPTPRAILNGENAIEEERRCLYVALTRAKDELRVYRDVHSIHTIPTDSYYFFNNMPLEMYEPEIIAANYIHANQDAMSLNNNQPIIEDIYSDFDLE